MQAFSVYYLVQIIYFTLRKALAMLCTVQHTSVDEWALCDISHSCIIIATGNLAAVSASLDVQVCVCMVLYYN